MATAKYRRIVLKLSGEALSGEQGYGIDAKVIQSIANQVKEVAELDVEVAVAAVEGVNDAADINGVGMLHIDVRQVGSGGIGRPYWSVGCWGYTGCSGC